MSATPSTFLNTGRHTFLDPYNRSVILRGVNLSGSSKFPAGQPSYVLHGFWEDAENGGPSFVGRPFNLDDGSADVHLARLRGWGYRMIRYVVVWEALEHEGPRKYDDEFIDYTVRVLLKCTEFGFRIYIDPHQDAWSRFSGGCGAPFWTFHACGLNPRAFTATNAAVLHCEFPEPENPDPASYPAMVWQTNNNRLAAATMFTLFFGGREYAPKCNIDGVNIQDYLQEHWTEAFGRLADAIAEYPELLDDCVLGWDSMNEPAAGWIGSEDLNLLPHSQSFRKYTAPTGIQAMKLGMGERVEVDMYDFGSFGCSKVGTKHIDPKGRRAWLDPSAELDGKSTRWGWTRDPGWRLGTCIWAQHGVWDTSSGSLLRPDYFLHNPTTHEKANFDQDFWLPYWRLFSHRIRRAHPNLISFIAPPVFHAPPQMSESDLRGRACLTPHYYDGLTLLSKAWHVWNAHTVGLERGKLGVLAAAKLGSDRVRKGLSEQLDELQQDALGGMSSQDTGGPEYPALIGEIGIPFDMNNGASYKGKHKDDFSNQESALDASLNACDAENGLGYTLWAYNPDNSHLWGDGFNGEDLSLWSIDSCSVMPVAGADEDTKPLFSPGYKPKSLYELLVNGSRAIRAFCRPYPLAIVGEYKQMKFDMQRPEFELTVIVSAQNLVEEQRDVPTEVFLPFVHFVVDENEEKWKDCRPPPFLQRLKDREVSGSKSTFRVLGAVDPREPLGLTGWKEDYARLDIRVEVSVGEVEVEGQVLRWKYAGEEEVKAGTELTLRVRRGADVGWGEEAGKTEHKGLLAKVFKR